MHEQEARHRGPAPHLNGASKVGNGVTPKAERREDTTNGGPTEPTRLRFRVGRWLERAGRIIGGDDPGEAHRSAEVQRRDDAFLSFIRRMHTLTERILTEPVPQAPIDSWPTPEPKAAAVARQVSAEPAGSPPAPPAFVPLAPALPVPTVIGRPSQSHDVVHHGAEAVPLGDVSAPKQPAETASAVPGGPSKPKPTRFLPNPISFLGESGLWYELNRLVLHPRGLMLVINEKAQDGQDAFGIVDGRFDPEGFCFEQESIEDAAKKIAAYDAQGANRTFEVRRRRYGYVVQPLAPKATITHPEIDVTGADVMAALPQDIRAPYESRLLTDVKQEQLRMIGIEAIGYVMMRTRAILDSERLAEHELLMLRQIILELATVFVAERLAWEDGNAADAAFAWLPSLRKSIDWRLALFRPQS